MLSSLWNETRCRRNTFVYLCLPDEDHCGAGEDYGQVVDLNVGLVLLPGPTRALAIHAAFNQLLLHCCSEWRGRTVEQFGTSDAETQDARVMAIALLLPSAASIIAASSFEQST